MLNKVIIIASTVGVAVSAPAEAKARHALHKQSVDVSNQGGNVVDASSIDIASEGKVTTGAWAKESHSSCSPLSTQPSVDGFVLGACQYDSTGSKTDNWCAWNAGKTSLFVNTLTYSTTDCTGTIASNTTVEYSGLVDGCEVSSLFPYNYQCGADVSFTNYPANEHVEYYQSTGCTGDAVAWNIYWYGECIALAQCSVYGGSSAFSTQEVCTGEEYDDDSVCFHIDTKIDYKGVEYTYEELKAGKEPECTVPHSPSSKGVVISTSCDKTVRVTDTHLMATTKGFQLAYSLKAGDVLFGDYGKDMCTVKSVEKENTTQQYFGLNCVHSEVLASGLRASTFGDFHTLPSWYMTYVGGLIGTDTASSLGEYIAEWYFQKT